MKTYLIAGAALMALAATSQAAEAKYTINICTGAAGQPYDQAAQMIKDKLSGDPFVDVRVITDTGGTWGNIQRTVLNGEPIDAQYESGEACHAFIGQPDGAVYLKRTEPGKAGMLRQIGTLHREYLHVLCSKASGVDDLYDIGGDKTKTVALGNQGSGAWLIWQNFIAEDESYKAIGTDNSSGIDAVAAVASDQITCTLIPAGLGNSTVREADELFGDQVALVGADDKDFNDAVDLQGKPLYEFTKIPSGTYPQHLQGWFSGKKTVSWKAAVYINKNRITDSKVVSSLIKAVARAKPDAEKAFGE